MHGVTELSWAHAAGFAAAVVAEPVTRRVLLVDDHELIRCGMRALYAEIDEIQVEWLEAATLDEGLEVYARQAPIDAVLLDLNLNDCKGLQGLRRFAQRFPGARVAVFSSTQDEFVVLQARALGAAGWLHKGAPMAELRRTLRALLSAPMSGRRNEAAATAALFPRCTDAALAERVSALGPRHLEILELLLSGCANQEISRCLSLSLGTVKNYVSTLLVALDVKSRAHLISLFH